MKFSSLSVSIIIVSVIRTDMRVRTARKQEEEQNVISLTIQMEIISNELFCIMKFSPSFKFFSPYIVSRFIHAKLVFRNFIQSEMLKYEFVCAYDRNFVVNRYRGKSYVKCDWKAWKFDGMEYFWVNGNSAVSKMIGDFSILDVFRIDLEPFGEIFVIFVHEQMGPIALLKEFWLQNQIISC